MRKYKIKLGFSMRNFCNKKYNLMCLFLDEVKALNYLDNEEVEISDRICYIKYYPYNSPIKQLREIIIRYRKLYKSNT